MDIKILDTDFKMVGVIDTYISFIWTDRYDEAGDFELVILMDTPVLNLIQTDYYLSIDASEHTMVIEDISVNTDIDTGKTMKIVGHSLEKLLDRRIIWEKTVFKQVYANDSDTVGVKTLLCNAISQILYNNIIYPTSTDYDTGKKTFYAARQIPNFKCMAPTDERVLIKTIEAQYRGESIYEVISSLCKENNIGFKVLMKEYDGKNVLPYPYTGANEKVDGLTITDNGDGTITVNGKAPSTKYDPDPEILLHDNIVNDIDLSKTYTFSGGMSNKANIHLIVYSNSILLLDTIVDNQSIDFSSFTKTVTKIKVSIKLDKDTTYDNLTIKPQMELGNAATSYEPYVGDMHHQFVFQLYSGADRTYDQMENPYVVFSPSNDNLYNSSYYKINSTFKNVALVLGEQVEETEKQNDDYKDYRHPVIVGMEAGVSRREIFVDASDVDIEEDEETTLTVPQYRAHLKQKGIDTLIDNLDYELFEGEVEATQMYKYGEDFFMGDRVQLEDEYGHEGKAYISEFIISHDTSGLNIYPTFVSIQEGEYDVDE